MTSETIQLKVTGMTCGGCASTIEKAVNNLDGVNQCQVNFTTETLHIAGTPTKAEVTNLVQSLGFGIRNEEEAAPPAPQNFWQYMSQRSETRLALIATALILPGLIFTELLQQEFIWVDALSLIAMLLVGWPIARSAYTAVTVSREININLLMTIAAVGAVIIGAYVEAGMVMVLFALGEALEGYTANRARNAIRSLMQVAPQVATRLRHANGEQVPQPELIPINDLHIGDIIRVKPGERIPMDGRIIAGHSSVDQAAITGESQPIDKNIGDTLFAGSINGQGALEVTVTHLAADNTISRMIRLVEDAQERRAPTQRFVDRFAHYYTPTVMVIALLTAVIPPLFFNQPFWNPADGSFGWLYRGLALLVVACPCALVISTPVTVISAISNAAKNGILIKGGAYLEALSRVQAVAFDKTGTLTQGKPTVVTVRSATCDQTTITNTHWQECATCEDVLALASAVEAQSEHPLAHAVITASQQQGISQQYPTAANVTALTGLGVTGSVAGRNVVIGSHPYFDSHVNHTSDHCQQATVDAQQGFTPMMVSADNTYLGTITVADTIRDSSRETIKQLKTAGLKGIIMLTGDATATAQRIGQSLGVTDVRAELLPQDKVTAVNSLQTTYGPIAMVGDGINDAPALATASVGIAMGGAGSTTQAMETADITLMQNDLRHLPYAFQLSRTAMSTIRANILFSIGIKVAFLLLVLVGIGTMWMAVLADVGTSVLVTLNGMRLLNKKRTPNGKAVP